MHNATAITAGSANQRPNTPCIRLWIDVTLRGLEHSYTIYFHFDRVIRNSRICSKKFTGVLMRLAYC